MSQNTNCCLKEVVARAGLTVCKLLPMTRFLNIMKIENAYDIISNPIFFNNALRIV